MPMSFYNLPITSNRIDLKFSFLKENNKKALIAYITAGDPDLKTTKRLIFTLEQAGVDIIEIGVPFSDPTADGPIIQASAQRALKSRTNLAKILALISTVRKKSSIPIVLFGYYNPIYAYGLSPFAMDAKKAGIDGVLIVDLPMEEAKDFRKEINKQGMYLISLIAPTTPQKRIQQIVKNAQGFLYYISITGITGTHLPQVKQAKEKIQCIRQASSLPIVLGFGIFSSEQAKKLSRLGDGIVVGSAFVKRVENSKLNGQLYKEIDQFARELKNAL